jgi:hypothetical protein
VEALMARPKAKGKGKPEPGPKTIGVRASAEYAAWVDRLAARNRTTVAGLVDQALARFAREIGFEEPPPER